MTYTRLKRFEPCVNYDGDAAKVSIMVVMEHGDVVRVDMLTHERVMQLVADLLTADKLAFGGEG